MLHPPLSDARLGARVHRLVGPDAGPAQRELAARALVPASGSDTWLALYHLWALGHAPHADIAGRTAVELPGPAIFAALADPLLPAPALDFMARRRLTHADELAVLVRHPQVDADTLALVARCGPPRACEAIALAHARMLAAPAILAALARNPRCPGAILHAAVELGARERAPGLRGLLQALLSGHVPHDRSDDHAARQLAALRSRAGDDLDPAPPLPPDPPVDDLPVPLAPALAPLPLAPARSLPPPAAGVACVLDPTTPLPLAMSLLWRLRRPDLRRVADARRLPRPLVAAARRRLGPS
ncbi:hypothetical protein [Nannocystis bainbridge]|uniref:Leucine rich repeat variant n=1 Tax=Nannocystis bainbridge TaxID=2995303 RepID=A0ABT5DXU7_9BACT|nr:hypothetical protein [Nannocystis bainbridge]MDC0717272.1 hypothetical protein [Nannocystis bainbridge]